jgi:hypothetical protein
VGLQIIQGIISLRVKWSLESKFVAMIRTQPGLIGIAFTFLMSPKSNGKISDRGVWQQERFAVFVHHSSYAELDSARARHEAS